MLNKISLRFLITYLLLLSNFGYKTNNQFATTKYAGEYSYDTKAKYGGGLIVIYPENDTTILFYLSLNKGAPSYSMGDTYGRLIVKNDKGIYKDTAVGDSLLCVLEINFSEKSLGIETLGDFNNCGYGHGVSADGEYVKFNNKIPKYFINEAMDTIYFNKTSPEAYNKFR